MSCSPAITVAINNNACDQAISVSHDFIQSEDVYNKFLAIEALNKTGHVTDTKPLLDAINANTPFITRAAIASILSIDKRELTLDLFELAKHDADVADLVTGELQYYPASSSLDYLTWYMSYYPEPKKVVRALKAAAASNNRLLGQYISDNLALFSDNPLVYIYALYAINKLTIDHTDLLKKVIASSNHVDTYVREMSAVVLGDLQGEEVKDRLIKLSSDTEIRVSTAAVISYKRINNDADISNLKALLKANKFLQSEIIAGGLKRLKSDDAVAITTEYISAEINPQISIRLIESLGHLKGEAFAIFKWALNQNDENLLTQTIFAIGSRGIADEKPLLVRFLKHKNPSLRSSASWAYLQYQCNKQTMGI